MAAPGGFKDPCRAAKSIHLKQIPFNHTVSNGLSILFIFSKNQLLALLIFAMVSFVSFSFISTLIFKISFLLLTLGFFLKTLQLKQLEKEEMVLP